MGKLYDRGDLRYDLDEIDKLEQGISQQILAGTFPAQKSTQAIELCDKERTRCKMRLLRSGALMRDLRAALKLFNACPHCFTDEATGKQHACGAHKESLSKAKQAIHFAIEENTARRLAAGRTRPDEDGEVEGNLNEYETWYFSDRREGIWPGSPAFPLDQETVRKYKEQYGSLDYRGWLQMLLQEEEIPYPCYVAELERLRGA